MMKNITADFPILRTKAHNHRLIYLDSAATAQKPQVVIDTVNDLHATCNANIHRGIHYLAEQTTLRYEKARERVCDFINGGDACQIVFTSGATASINLVASSFGEKFIGCGDNVIISQAEHHSNIVPWQMIAERKGAQIRVLPFTDEGRIEVEKLDGLIDEHTKMVAITQASNVLGTMPDIGQITEIAHNRGVPVLIDGCQGIVHAPTDVRALDVDFYCFSGHKLYAPTGIGVLYGKQKWLEQMPPYMGGGDMVETVSLTKGTTYAGLPLKFEAGTANFTGAIALGRAIEYVKELGEDAHNYTAKLNNAFAQMLQERIEGVRIYGVQPHKTPLTSFTIEGTHPMDIAMIVDKLGVAIRSGTHCAQPVMTHYGVTSMCRASFAPYNTEQDVEEAIAAIERAAKMLR